MIGRIFHKNAEMSGDEALAAALTSDSETTRIFARGAAASWLPDFVRWINDEINRPKADHVAILSALALVQLQTIASVAAQLMDEEGDPKFVQAYLETANSTLKQHMARTRSAAAEDWS